jgi:hypothetical protein
MTDLNDFGRVALADKGLCVLATAVFFTPTRVYSNG